MSVYQSLASNIDVLKSIILNLTEKTENRNNLRYEEIFEHSNKLLDILKDVLLQRYNSCDNQLATLNYERTLLENAALQTEVERLRANSVEAASESSRITNLQTENAVILEDNEVVIAEITQKKHEIEELRVINDEMEKRINSMEERHGTEKQDLELQVHALKAANAKLSEDALVLIAHINKLKIRLRNKNEQFEEAQERILSLENTLHSYDPSNGQIKRLHYAEKQENDTNAESSSHIEHKRNSIVTTSTSESLSALKAENPVPMMLSPRLKHDTGQLAQILAPPEAVLTNELYRSRKHNKTAQISDKFIAENIPLDVSLSEEHDLDSCQRNVVGSNADDNPEEEDYNDVENDIMVQKNEQLYLELSSASSEYEENSGEAAYQSATDATNVEEVALTAEHEIVLEDRPDDVQDNPLRVEERSELDVMAEIRGKMKQHCEHHTPERQRSEAEGSARGSARRIPRESRSEWDEF